ncbi:anti-sigma factor family protein [Bythopirellula goksoeyrii]|uniref:Uncharacterized protein n=1 Tax=Bythopirellula goksoeyrii TaxID=1400387 RepID=A0A5B9QID6_9BACT|nr:zf-HC2 domain-containing protein [Bythopirellula goksoeyrii]QEG37749.1 hypothetical protein Pr1d_50960 [Bythopirellula goksoeyrii]
MSELNNQPDFDDSLLSAYVDGELTDEQRAMVEARLAEDPQARQLVAELEAVSSKVRSLPRVKATEDMRAAVFQQIDGPSVPLQPSELTMRKRLLWPLLATAALLMLMFYQPAGNEKEVELAQIDKAPVGKERANAKDESAPQALSELKAIEEVPKADAFGAPRLRDESSTEGIAAAPSDERSDIVREMATDSAVALGVDHVAGSLIAPESNVGLVHVTLKDLRSGAEHFDRLLVANDIQIVDEPVEQDAKASFRGSGLYAESRDGGVAGAASQSDSSKDESKSLQPKGKTQTPAAEMVFVEAPPEQLAKFFFACSQDTEAIQSLTIDEPANAVSGGKPTEQLEQYRQYEKPMRQQAAPQNYVVTPEQQGVIAALNSLDLASEPTAGSASAGLQQQAWATKLRNNQSPVERKQLEEQIQSRRNLDSSDKKRKLAKKDADSPPPMRVLFLLHESETSEK